MECMIFFWARKTLLILTALAFVLFIGDKVVAEENVEGPFLGETVIPHVFEGDLRDLPTAEAWQQGDAMRIVPEGLIPVEEDLRPVPSQNGQTAPDIRLDRTSEPEDFATSEEDFSSGVNFEGIGNTGATPPDTVGDVGSNHYIQMVNASQFQIWDKSGNTLAGPTALDSLGTGACANGGGDPIVLYDELADRWMMSEFARIGNHLCVYISRTADPVSGGWFAYDFTTPTFPDYPKYGVWPDAYYVSDYEGSNLGVFALDRTNMLAGSPARPFVRFTIPSLNPVSGMNIRNTRILPSELDGPAPPSSSPNYFFRSVEALQDSSNQVDRLEVYEFDVDFVTPANSTFTNVATLKPSNFSLVPCSPGIRDCIPQPGTARLLDALSNRPMRRAQYRNFGSHETLVTNQSVDAGGGVSGIRWWELRKNGGSWSIFQEGTHSPDTTDRWMGSIAMDQDGNMAVGYSVSSSTVFPSIRYTGRLASDISGTMPQGEFTIINGTGSQTFTQRWGDYSAMSVDPADDCTFWFTTEYMPASGNPSCGATIAKGWPTGLA